MALARIDPPAAFVFDAYGTLFDVHSVAALAEELAPGPAAMRCRARGARSSSSTRGCRR